jgi:hypothetical protein
MLDFEVDRQRADRILRGIPGFEGFDEQYDLYYFRRDVVDALPDAHAKIERSGIYLCFNGGSHDIIPEIRAAFAAIGFNAELREL